jgi:hypothetical protein
VRPSLGELADVGAVTALPSMCPADYRYALAELSYLGRIANGPDDAIARAWAG